MPKIILQPEYPYLYETHLHTSHGSACGIASPREMVEAYLAAGYTGIFITEHNWGGYTAVPTYLTWSDWVRRFTSSYYEAKEYGEQCGLEVYWGYEAGFNAIEYLVLGLTPEFLENQPDLRNTSMKEHYHIVKSAGGMIVHAHPFREAYYIPKTRPLPKYSDAVEGINATHHNRYFPNNHVFDERAIDYANRHNLPLTGGSDMHSTRLIHGGMSFATHPADEKAIIGQIATGSGYVLTDGVFWYDAKGAKMGDVRYYV
ncbi:MAG: PHP domain-containing protein [Lachnospiraceae bacterium]|jgi:predicted metal-dependent phosphoesterase TrpH|nr:PHP domain-containing protein [Lachnospiraceae bacterium]